MFFIWAFIPLVGCILYPNQLHPVLKSYGILYSCSKVLYGSQPRVAPWYLYLISGTHDPAMQVPQMFW